MHFFKLFLGILCSSTLFALGIANEFFHFGSAILGFTGLSLLYYVLSHCKSYKEGAILYATHTVLVHLISSFWLAFFEDFAIFTLGGTSLAYFFLALPFGVFFVYLLNKKTPLRIFTFASLWLGWEFFKSNGFLAYPWGTVPMFCFNLKNFIQFVDITGVRGLSFVVALISASAAEILTIYTKSYNLTEFRKKIRPFIPSLSFIAILVVLLNIYGIVITNKNIKPKTYLNTVIVQQNADPWNVNDFEENLIKAQNLTRKAIKDSTSEVDLIVWSESSIPNSYVENKYIYSFFPETDPFESFIEECNIPILIGTPSFGKNSEMHNSACLITPNDDNLQLYSKMQLVAFAEYIPFSNNPIVKTVLNKIVGFSSGFTPGKEYTVFDVKDKNDEPVKFTVPICFEDAFPTQCIALHNQGSELLLNITNDSWSKTDSAEYQHFVVAYFRALELRTTLVRSTNSGYSAVVDPFGNILDSLPLFKEDYMLVNVPIYEHRKTIFAIFKNWFPTIILFILLKLLIQEWVDSIKKKASAAVPSCHWQEKPPRKRSIRRYKPAFAVKRRKSLK